jgi:membrane-associated phospholipid phosphatase
MEFFVSNEWVSTFHIPLLTGFFKCVPTVVGKTFQLMLICIGYWTLSRVFFRYIGIVTCLSVLLNNVLKVLFAIPRPNIDRLIVLRDPYGFPSGDIQIAATFWTLLALRYASKKLRVFSALMLATIAVSRVYLGAHTVRDVLFGWFVGTCLAIAAWALYRRWDFKRHHYLQAVVTGVLVAAMGVHLFVNDHIFSHVAMCSGFALGISLSCILNRTRPDTLRLNAGGILLAYATTVLLRLGSNVWIIHGYPSKFWVAFALALYALWLFERWALGVPSLTRTVIDDD